MFTVKLPSDLSTVEKHNLMNLHKIIQREMRLIDQTVNQAREVERIAKAIRYSQDGNKEAMVRAAVGLQERMATYRSTLKTQANQIVIELKRRDRIERLLSPDSPTPF